MLDGGTLMRLDLKGQSLGVASSLPVTPTIGVTWDERHRIEGSVRTLYVSPVSTRKV